VRACSCVCMCHKCTDLAPAYRLAVLTQSPAAAAAAAAAAFGRVCAERQTKGRM